MDIKQTGSFTLSKAIIVKKESVALTTQEKINEIKP